MIVQGTKLIAGISPNSGGGGGIFTSTDNGTNWTQVGMSGIYIGSFAVSGTNIFAGTASGVFRSTNNGTNWTKVNNGLVNNYVNALTVSGTNIFAGTDDGVFLSTNNGNNWALAGLDGMVTTLAVNNNNIFAGNEGGVWRRPLSEILAVSTESNDIPKEFILSQNYPNPFNPNTVISYSIPSSSNVKLIVYNTLGQTIKVLENEFNSAGNYSINFNASDLPSGIYFYKLESAQFSQTKKMLLLK